MKKQLSKLVPHPFHGELYDSSGKVYDDGVEALKESLERIGQLQPVILLSDGKTIVDGCRRVEALKASGQKTCECVVRVDLTDEIDIREAIVEYNRQRVKTKLERANERIAVQNILAERADAAKKANLKKGDKSPPVDAEAVGRTDVIAAKKVGDNRSRATIRRETELVKAWDEMAASGDPTQVKAADAGRNRLNEGESVTALHREYCSNSDSNGRKKKKTTPAVPTKPSELKSVHITAIDESRAKDACDVLSKLPKGLGIGKSLTEIRKAVSDAPLSVPTIKDKRKQDIPPRLRPLFNDPDYDVCIKQLQTMVATIKSIRGHRGMWLESGMIIEALQSAISKLQDARVEVVCPACSGSGCLECRKTGAMPAWAYTTWKAEQ